MGIIADATDSKEVERAFREVGDVDLVVDGIKEHSRVGAKHGEFVSDEIVSS